MHADFCVFNTEQRVYSFKELKIKGAYVFGKCPFQMWKFGGYFLEVVEQMCIVLLPCSVGLAAKRQGSSWNADIL